MQINFEKILNYTKPVLTNHSLAPTPDWFKKEEKKLSVIVPINGNADSFFYCYQTSKLDAEYIFLTNQESELLDYFEMYQKPVGKIVNYFDDYSDFDLYQIGSTYASSDNLLWLSPYVVPPKPLPDFVSDCFVTPCIIHENGKVFSGGRMWEDGWNKFPFRWVEIGNSWVNHKLSPFPILYDKIEKEIETVDSMHLLCCLIPKPLVKQYLFADDMFMSRTNLSDNTKYAILLNENNYKNDIDNDLFYNKWVNSNEIGHVQDIRGVLLKCSHNVDQAILDVRKKYNCKVYLLSTEKNDLADHVVQSYKECERAIQVVVNLDSIHDY